MRKCVFHSTCRCCAVVSLYGKLLHTLQAEPRIHGALWSSQQRKNPVEGNPEPEQQHLEQVLFRQEPLKNAIKGRRLSHNCSAHDVSAPPKHLASTPPPPPPPRKLTKQTKWQKLHLHTVANWVCYHLMWLSSQQLDRSMYSQHIRR